MKSDKRLDGLVEYMTTVNISMPIELVLQKQMVEVRFKKHKFVDVKDHPLNLAPAFYKVLDGYAKDRGFKLEFNNTRTIFWIKE